MYHLHIKSKFSAAHRLCGYDGECANLHGHTWAVEVSLAGQQLDSVGMLIDFKVLKGMLKEVIKDMDHSFLNELPYFNQPDRLINPTAENLSKYIYQRIKTTLSEITNQLRLTGVTVWESPDAWVTYEE